MRKADVKLSDYGTAMIRAVAANCSNPEQLEAYLEAVFQYAKLKCSKCNHEFDVFQKKLIAIIDRILEQRNGQFNSQYHLAKAFGVLSATDKVQCPKCGSEEAYITDEIDMK